MSDLNFMFAFALILAFFTALIALDIPEEYRLMNAFDLGILTTEIIGVAGTCVLATGIPCAIAFIVTSVFNVLNYVIINNELVKAVIFMPIFVIFTFVLAKLARGVR